MQFNPPLMQGRLVRRYKRFLADIVTEAGDTLTIHCPNTGAMHGCNEPDSLIWYSRSDNAKRKYPHTLEAVHTQHGIAGVNTARAKALVAEALTAERIAPLSGYAVVSPEARVPTEVALATDEVRAGRFDFCLSQATQDASSPPCYVEVKSVTYALGAGLGVFPDAVSTRALRHLQALCACKALGWRAVLLFCVQHTGIERVAPALEVYPEYAQALVSAQQQGVEILAYSVQLTAEEFVLNKPLPVVL